MVQSPFWAGNRFAASQEIRRISRNPKVHYRTHKRPPPMSGQHQQEARITVTGAKSVLEVRAKK